MLDEEHIAFLTAQETLISWAGRTLAERAKLFHRRFPNKWIKPRALLRLYGKHGIRKKRVRLAKDYKPHKAEEYEALRLEARDELQGMFDVGIKVVFIDEVVFTSKTCQMRDYSNRHLNVRIGQAKLDCPYLSVIASISTDGNVELLQMREGAVDDERFEEYIRALEEQNRNVPLCLFMDNLAVHKRPICMQAYEELAMNVVLNVPYSPDYQPIETVFSIVKRYYKKNMLQLVANDQPVDACTLIRQAFD